MNIFFVTVEQSIELHDELIDLFGGSFGLRDRGLLESAIDMPKASFGGQFLHETIFEMAAAYLFHICKNHPFVDGNKRTSLSVAMTFLAMNGLRVKSSEDLEQMVVDTAISKINKKQIAALLDSWSEKI